MDMIKPGSTIGILGGGQLGRMIALAAAPLGYKCHIYCPEADSPAFQVADSYTVAAYEDEAALEAFAKSVDVVTYEFENVPAKTAEVIGQHALLRPGAMALATAQDRLVEKIFLSDHGLAVAPFKAFESLEELEAAVEEIGMPAIAKTRCFGYDGKGQAIIRSSGDIEAAHTAMGGAPAILEGFVPFNKEVSAIVARNPQGSVAAYPIAENVHINHILDVTTVPANIDSVIEDKARIMGAKLTEALEYIGVITVELFIIEDSGEVIVNEFAPRVHNSGHWSIEGARTSQFEQHVRAICGLPLGDPRNLGKVRMKNLLGEDINDVEEYLNDPKAHYHHYGKSEPREGRKMGHVTWVDAD